MALNYCTHLPKTKVNAVPRIIVIGDIHGDWVALKSALKVAGVTNHHNDWIGHGTHVVQVGDLVDRAVRGGSGDERSESRILRHLLDLKTKAQRAGDDVHLLLGNHELMNVMGNFSYVSPMGMTDFDGQRQEVFRPGGSVAKKLACNANAVVQIGSWLFSHAGVTSKVSKTYTMDEVNSHIRDYLLGNAILNRDHPIMDIFWHRKYGNEGACPLVRDALSNWKARNMAIGHTVQDQGINSICDESLWKVDTGMSDAFGNRSCKQCVEVLEILDDGDTINILRGTKEFKSKGQKGGHGGRGRGKGRSKGRSKGRRGGRGRGRGRRRSV